MKLTEYYSPAEILPGLQFGDWRNYRGHRHWAVGKQGVGAIESTEQGVVLTFPEHGQVIFPPVGGVGVISRGPINERTGTQSGTGDSDTQRRDDSPNAGKQSPARSRKAR